MVLVALVPLLLLAAHITSPGDDEGRIAGALKGAARAEAVADGAIFETAFHLAAAAPPSADGQPARYQSLGATVTVCVINESGRINPNLVNAGLMAALLRAAGLPPSDADHLADGIHAWRDGTGRTFADIQELTLVPGITPDLLARIAPALTVLTDDQIDPLAAPPLVVQALMALLGHDPTLTAKPVPPRTVRVEAEATTPDGTRFVREAAVRLDPTGEQPPRILTWDHGDLARCHTGT
jgi:general secretion pathway protein K